jgi:hypothetical protein
MIFPELYDAQTAGVRKTIYIQLTHMRRLYFYFQTLCRADFNALKASNALKRVWIFSNFYVHRASFFALFTIDASIFIEI